MSDLICILIKKDNSPVEKIITLKRYYFIQSDNRNEIHRLLDEILISETNMEVELPLEE